MSNAPPAIAEGLARTGEADGTRSYQSAPDTRSGVLVDRYGRLIVTTSGPTGNESGGNGTDFDYSQQFVSGSAPEYDNVGLIQTHRVMQSPQDALGQATGVITCLRMFGYAAVAGWVQLILKDEGGGANPPVLNDVPEITIAIGANQNFFFGNWILANNLNLTADKATYIAMSTTGPTYTPGGANLWFTFLGAL